MNKGKQYALYLDDSGGKEYAIPPETYGRTGKSRYFLFGGLLATTADAGLLSEQVREAKRQTFGTDKVEIKSNWLRMPKEREKRYKLQYDVSDDEISNFVDKYYGLISQADVKLLAAVVDKVHMQEDYAKPWYAPAVAYETLLQRVMMEIRKPDRVSVVIDDMSGATPKGNQYKSNLIAHHRQLMKSGSRLQKGLDFSPLFPKITFRDSAVAHLIQVADIVSYNVYRQFLDHGDDWEWPELATDGKRTLPTYERFHTLVNKFCQGRDGRVRGYGLVKFPMRNRIPWKWQEVKK